MKEYPASFSGRPFLSYRATLLPTNKKNFKEGAKIAIK